MSRVIVGIAGGTGSGKSTIANKIAKAFEGRCTTLAHDYYYKDSPNLTYEERARQNYDHPDSLDTDLLVEHLRLLKEGKSIKHPTYDFAKHLRCDQWIEVNPSDIIIVEGILIFENKQLCDMCDIKIYVDTDDDVRFIRRLTRDVRRRGRTMESVISQWLSTVKPMHDMFVLPSKRAADIIVPEGGHNLVAIDMIVNGIERRLKKADV